MKYFKLLPTLAVTLTLSVCAYGNDDRAKEIIKNCEIEIKLKYEYDRSDRYGNISESFFEMLELSQLVPPGGHRYGANQALMFAGIMVNGGQSRRTSVMKYRIFCIVDTNYKILGIERELRP